MFIIIFVVVRAKKERIQALQLEPALALPSSPIHLPLVMPPNAPYRLPQGISPAVLVIRMGSLVLVEYDHRLLLRILRIMQIPVMPRVPAHDRHIVLIHIDDLEILRIQAFQIFITEHGQPPSRQTTHPGPALPDPSVPLHSSRRNTFPLLPQVSLRSPPLPEQ